MLLAVNKHAGFNVDILIQNGYVNFNHDLWGRMPKMQVLGQDIIFVDTENKYFFGGIFEWDHSECDDEDDECEAGGCDADAYSFDDLESSVYLGDPIIDVPYSAKAYYQNRKFEIVTVDFLNKQVTSSVTVRRF